MTPENRPGAPVPQPQTHLKPQKIAPVTGAIFASPESSSPYLQIASWE